MTKWISLWAVLFLVSGCGQGDSAESTGRGSGNKGVASQTEEEAVAEGRELEEFEGTIELFGQTLRARRQVKLTPEGDYVKHGKALAWYTSGQKAGEMNFRDGVPHGAQMIWHENGKKKSQGEWKNGMAVGIWKEWHDNGQLAHEGKIEQGQKHGRWSFWNADGGIQQELEFLHGKQVKVLSSAPDESKKRR